MGALQTKISDQLILLDSEEAALEEYVKRRRLEIAARRLLLQRATTKVTQELDDIVASLGVEVK